jgi:hypothetical protein
MTNIQGNNRQLFVLEGTSEEIEEIIALFESGELSELLGVDVLDAGLVSESQMSEINRMEIQDVQSVDTAIAITAEEQEAFANNLLKKCRKEGYSWIELSDILVIVQQAYQATEEVIASAFRELLFPDTLAGATKKSDTIDENYEDKFAEAELDTKLVNSLTREVVRFYEK